MQQLTMNSSVNSGSRSPLGITEARYTVRLAHTGQDLDRLLRLRFEVFNLELGEGLDSSFVTGRDRDQFDSVCDHLIVQENATGAIVGTYRMQTYETARAGYGFYSADEFDLSPMPADVLTQSMEIGRACIMKEHRNGRVLFLLWRGLARYLAAAQKRYLFGCCSLTSQNPFEGRQVFTTLQAGRHMNVDFVVPPQPDYVCYTQDLPPRDEPEVKIPRLFQLYLNLGAKVCGPPAMDRRFRTIDYLVLLDTAAMDSQTREVYFK